MRKLLLVAALVVAPTFAFAEMMDTQPVAPAQQHHLAVAPQVVMPLGDWADSAGLGFGVTLNYEYALNPMLDITGRVGYVHHLGTELEGTKIDVHTTEIPVLAGVKYNFIPNVYGQAEFGLWHIGFGASEGPEADAINRFGLTLGAGYEMDNLAFGLQYIMPNLIGKEDETVNGVKVEEKNLGGVMLNAAYTFMGF